MENGLDWIGGTTAVSALSSLLSPEVEGGESKTSDLNTGSKSQNGSVNPNSPSLWVLENHESSMDAGYPSNVTGSMG